MTSLFDLLDLMLAVTVVCNAAASAWLALRRAVRPEGVTSEVGARGTRQGEPGTSESNP